MSTPAKISADNLQAHTPTTGATTPDNLDSLEKASSQNLTADAPAPPQYVRPISNKKWASVCLGLFLAAMLYGVYCIADKDFQNADLPYKASTRPLRQMYKDLS